MSASPVLSPTYSGDLTIDDILDSIRKTALAVWNNTTKRVRMTGAFLALFTLTVLILQPSVPDVPDVPQVYFDYGRVSPFNETKVALLIENRPNPILAPLMLHFMSVVPPDWRFRFMGSPESVEYINQSTAIQHKQHIGKLDLTLIPSNMSTAGPEMISRFLTNLWLYENVLQPAKHLLVFQTDSILCANSPQSLNNWLDYDWVGAPWNPNGRFGGNGGLSLRKVDAIIEVLRNQNRTINSAPEDVWLTDRLGARPNAKMANGTTSLTFSGEMFTGNAEKVDKHESKKLNGKLGIGKPKPEEQAKEGGGWVAGVDDWRDGFYEPMGYHTGGSGVTLHPGIWGTPEMRQHIYKYCPEVKMTVTMDAAQYVPGECGANWKRDPGEEEDELAWMDQLVPF